MAEIQTKIQICIGKKKQIITLHIHIYVWPTTCRTYIITVMAAHNNGLSVEVVLKWSTN